MAAMEDLAAKLGIDALEFFLKNLEFAPEALREHLSRRAERRGGADRLQAQGPSARRQDQRPDQARPGHLAAYLGRRKGTPAPAT